LKPILARSAPSSEAELVADDISVTFGALVALSHVSLSLRRGEVLGVIGPNGAGKTTLVNCLTGFQRPSSGTVRLGGTDLTGWNARQFSLAGIARTFQAGRLFKSLTVLENVTAPVVAMGVGLKQAREQAMAILAWFGIADMVHRTTGTLPYTDARRVAIARAMVMAPIFLLLDEPAAGMSDAECDDLMRSVAEIPSLLNCGILLIEHNMRVVMGVSSRVHVLNGGSTLAEGQPKKIQEDPAVIGAYLGVEA
jgi:branched-chain amino acid transport system ATP-binding protein